MEALKSIAAQVPAWLPRLDDLSAQIEQRQIDLAACADAASVRAPSLRNRGSTESLRPKDEDAERAREPAEEDLTAAADGAPAEKPAAATAAETTPTPAAPSADAATPAVTTPTQTTPTPDAAPAVRDASAMPAPAPRRVRQTVQRKHKSDSVASINLDEVASPAAAAGAAGRTRTMIIVYYDSYVQSFFEDLVKFISVSRNHMRKAKMAAKVAQIKRMAEEEFNGDAAAAVPELATKAYRTAGANTRLPSAPRANRYGPMSANLKDKFSDVYSQLDEHLEFVQTTSERAAHQFLREGDCDAEIEKIRTRIRQALELAESEMARLLKENPELALEPVEGPRTHRPPIMRRENGKKAGSDAPAAAAAAAAAPGSATAAAAANTTVTFTPAPMLEAADSPQSGANSTAPSFGSLPPLPGLSSLPALSALPALAALPSMSDLPPITTMPPPPSTTNKRPLDGDVIEVDANDDDEGIEVDIQPAKTQYRSTRAMRRV